MSIEWPFPTTELFYPCLKSNYCESYSRKLTPGKYFFELYGASGGDNFGSGTSKRYDSSCSCIPDSDVSRVGGNTVCKTSGSVGGAGGYSSGILTITKPTTIFINIGGAGEYYYPPFAVSTGPVSDEFINRPKGGFNGGGHGTGFNNGVNSGAGSGGGSTDLRIGENDLYHRILVAGGGGGADNFVGTCGGGDDGSGGAGGGLIAQGFWIDGLIYSNRVANQTFGFSFGQGESARYSGTLHPFGSHTTGGASDRSGGGGGWFGGFSSHHGQGGAGGGSSYALTSTSIIPQGLITIYSDMYDPISSGYYAFNNSSPYCLSNVTHAEGVWSGNGKARITQIEQYFQDLTYFCPNLTSIHLMNLIVQFIFVLLCII